MKIRSWTSDFLSQCIWKVQRSARWPHVGTGPDPVRLPPAGGATAPGMPKKRVTNTGMRGNKTAKWFEGFDLHGEIKSRPQHTHRCTECRIPNCLMNSHRVLVFKCLNIHITSNDIWMRPLRFGLTELCQWMWALVLVTVNNTNVWLFTHLTFVEPYLTVGEGTDQHVNAGCNEAVISHAVVHCVDSVRSVWTEKWKNSKHVP